MIKKGDIIELDNLLYEVCDFNDSFHLYSLYCDDNGIILFKSCNKRIYERLDIDDIKVFFDECNIEYITEYDIWNWRRDIAPNFVPKNLIELQKLIDILNEIIPYGSYKGYLRDQKLKQLKDDM